MAIGGSSQTRTFLALALAALILSSVLALVFVQLVFRLTLGSETWWDVVLRNAGVLAAGGVALERDDGGSKAPIVGAIWGRRFPLSQALFCMA